MVNRMASISELLKQCETEKGPVAELVKALAKKVLEVERWQKTAERKAKDATLGYR
jgi:hypothetical protein